MKSQMDLRIDRPLIRWGNGYGIRLTKKEVEALGLEAGEHVVADVHGREAYNDLSALPLFNFLGSAEGHDDDVGADLDADH